MLQVGDKVPDFTLPVGYADARREKLALYAALEKGPVILSFFPLAFTSTCTTQMCDARDNASVFSRMGATLYGFSCDSVFANQGFAREQNLAHGIVSDANREVVDALWLTTTTVGVARVPRRGFLVIATDATVAGVHLQEPGTPWVGNKAIEEVLANMAPRA